MGLTTAYYRHKTHGNVYLQTEVCNVFFKKGSGGEEINVSPIRGTKNNKGEPVMESSSEIRVVSFRDV